MPTEVTFRSPSAVLMEMSGEALSMRQRGGTLVVPLQYSTWVYRTGIARSPLTAHRPSPPGTMYRATGTYAGIPLTAHWGPLGPTEPTGEVERTPTGVHSKPTEPTE